MRSAAAAQDDFLSGLPMRAGMASGEARRVGGADAPCLADGPAASCDMLRKRPRKDALLEAEELLDKTLRSKEWERDSRNLRRRVDGLNNLLDKERERARERVEELERSNRILRQ